MADEDLDPVEAVTWMIRGQWVTLAIRAGVELGLFDMLDEPRSVRYLAEGCATEPVTLGRLVRVLLDLGLLEAAGSQVDSEQVLSATTLGATLALGHSSGLRDLALMQTVLPNLASWQRLSEAIRSGGSVFETVNGMSPWQSLAEDPVRAAHFNASMARRAGAQATSILTACDLDGVTVLVDVGGGRGAMVGELLRALPRLQAIVGERPDVAAAANAFFDGVGLAGRGRAVESDFFVSVPAGGDAYVIANVLHDWSDDEAIRILSTVHEAMRPAARLWIVEQVLDAPGRSFDDRRDVHLIDLHMLVMFGGRERKVEEYDRLLASADFETGRLLAETRSWNVIETRPRG